MVQSKLVLLITTSQTHMAQKEPFESESDSDDEEDWMLGFAEPPIKNTDLLRHRFPSKIGGRPAWLDPLHLPRREQLTCSVTGKLMNFLLQVRTQ